MVRRNTLMKGNEIAQNDSVEQETITQAGRSGRGRNLYV